MFEYLNGTSTLYLYYICNVTAIFRLMRAFSQSALVKLLFYAFVCLWWCANVITDTHLHKSI